MVPYQNINIPHYDLRMSFSEQFLGRWRWEAFITLSFHRSVNNRTAIKEAKQLLKACKSKFRKMRCAGILLYAISPAENSHVHILLTSDQRYPQTLSNYNWDSIRSPIKWIEYYWRYWEKGTCEITRGWRQDVICNYLSKPKNFPTWNSDRYEIDYFRLNLLMQLKGDKKLVIVSEKY
jgi:hypothetical protein